MLLILGIVGAVGFFGAFLALEARTRRAEAAVKKLRAEVRAQASGGLELVRVPVRPEPGLSDEAVAIGIPPIAITYEPIDMTLINEAYANAERLTMRRRQ